MQQPPNRPAITQPETRPSNPGPDGYLAFDLIYLGLLIAGLKTATIRVDLDRDFHCGDLIRLQTPNGTVFARARVTKVRHTTIQRIVDRPPHGHTTYDSVPEACAALRQYYPTTTFDVRTPVTVIHFDTVQLATH